MKEYICKEVPTENGGYLEIKTKVIRCKYCKYYDPPHVEKYGERYEYDEFPPEAFDILLDRSVTVEYGINVGGRCCRYCDIGYSDDKRVFVSPDNYCGMAEPKVTK